jgi:hypothetical protein
VGRRYVVVLKSSNIRLAAHLDGLHSARTVSLLVSFSSLSCGIMSSTIPIVAVDHNALSVAGYPRQRYNREADMQYAQSVDRPSTSASTTNDYGERNAAGRNWSRTSRRSAPSRISNPADSAHYLAIPHLFAAASQAPSNDPNSAASQIGTTGASNVARRRLPVVKNVDQRNFDLSDAHGSKKKRPQQQPPQVGNGRRKRASGRFTPSVASVEENAASVDGFHGDEDVMFGPGQGDSGGFFRPSGTGDIDDDDGADSDSSYGSFTDFMQRKAVFSANATGSEQDTLVAFEENEDPSDSIGPTTTVGDDLKRAASSPAQEDKSIVTMVYRVYRSFYSGEDFSNGTLRASVTTGTNKKMFQHELTRPLFRWVHVENPTMNFSAFGKVAMASPWVTPQQRTIIDGILKTARSRSERSLNNISASNTGSAAGIGAAKKGSYVEPEYYEESVRQTIYQGFRSRSQKTETIRWMCVPYFFVRDPEPKAKGRRKTTDHDFIGNTYEPQSSFLLPPLDSGYVAEGARFQVAQLWVLIVGESLILTCARRGIEEVMRTRRSNEVSETMINIQTLPPANPTNRSVGDRAPVLIVSDGGIRTWLLPVDKCLHWPEFTANFAELGVDLFDGWDLMYQDYKLSSKDWPQLMEQAKKSSVRLVLERKEEDDSSDDDSEDYSSDEPDPYDEEDAAAGANSTAVATTTQPGVPLNEPITHQDILGADQIIEQWHVFTLLATTPSKISVAGVNTLHPVEDTGKLQVDDKILQEDANDVDNYLTTTNRRQGEKEAYRNCHTATYAQVRDFAKTLKTDPQNDPNGINTDRLRLIKSARHMFTFFYPISFDHVVTHKYWGAVLQILQSEQPNFAYFRARVRRVRFIHHVIDNLKEELFSRRSPEYNTTNVPHEFIQAFLMLTMFLVLFTTDQAKRSADYTKRCRLLLAQGKFKVIRRLQTVSLREKEAILPLGVASMLAGKLLENARGDQDFTDRQRLLSGYFSDLQQLTDAVRDDPLSRKYQDTFVNMKSEIEAILATIEDQQRVMVALDDGVNELEARSVISGAESSRARSRESIILETTLENAEQTQYSFVQMERRRAELEAWVSFQCN